MTHENETELRCDKIVYSNTTFLNSNFNGIPENLLINFAISFVILLIFLQLKFYAWKYQNVFNIYKDGWIALLYRDVFDLIPESDLNHLNCKFNPLDARTPYCKMLWFCFFGITNEEIMERSGDDAIQYLTFLKRTIEYSVIDMVLVIVCVLPVNYQGSLHEDGSYFARTTVGNIDFQRASNLLWMHISVGLVLMIACLIFIRLLSFQLVKYRTSDWAEKSVILKEKAARFMTVDRIEKYIRDVLPYASVQDIKLVYEYKRLIQMKEKLNALEEALAICELIQEVEYRRVIVKERCWCCGFYFRIFKKEKLIDGLTYYKKERDKMKLRVANELNRLPTRILHMAFVTFRKKYTAFQVRDQTPSTDLEDYRYIQLQKARDPRNIIWENLKRQPSNFTFKTLFINTAVFFIAVFLTTPTVIVSSVDFIRSSQMLNSGIFRFIPTLIVWILARVIAALVTYSSSYLDFKTKSGMNRSIMLKTVSFLMFTVVILPSLGLKSIKAFVTWTLTNGTFEGKWGCIFLPDNGAFFVNYLMTSAFAGNVVQLLRLPEVFMCLLGIIMSKSEAEKITIRKTYLWDFTYGVQYSHSLLMFTLVQFFSLLCPLISPFGLVYFLVKIAVDRYNICFGSRPSRNSSNMHMLALDFMIIALIMKYVGLFFLIYIRGGPSQIAHASTILMFLALFLCIFPLNPCRVKFLPRIFLMPHQIYRRAYHDFFEIDLPSEDMVFQPFALRRYLCLLSPLDRFGNPLPVVNDEFSELSELSESSIEDSEIYDSFCKI